MIVTGLLRYHTPRMFMIQSYARTHLRIHTNNIFGFRDQKVAIFETSILIRKMHSNTYLPKIIYHKNIIKYENRVLN